jgi:hypothetical protein
VAEYARAAAVYRELRTALGPWFKEHGYRRRPGSEQGWERGKLSFWFRVNPWSGGGVGGGAFSGTCEFGPFVTQSDVSSLLRPQELDELREIQNAINRRRPRTPELEAWMREDSNVGESTRALYRQYAPNEKPYRVGDFAAFGYYTLGDVRFHTGFLARYMPEIVARFGSQYQT